MKKLFYVSLFLFLVIGTHLSFSQDLPDKYLMGTINADPNYIETIIIVRSENEEFFAELYIPDQFVYNLKSSKVVFNSDSITIRFPRLADYEAVWSDSVQGYKGLWKQGNQSFPTDLKLVSKTDVDFIARPQTPKEPFDYIVREISVENAKGNSVLAGTLTLPDTIGTYPLVIMITGSGAQNRDEEIAGHKPFLIIADYFAKNGIAVFRYDDRGYAKSKGNLAISTTEDFMTDAYAVVNYFKNFKNIFPDKIGVIGHSEGGIIAMMLAAKYPKDISFIISMAGPGVPIKQLMVKQMKDISLAQGIDPETVEILSEMQARALDIPEKAKNQTEMRALFTELYGEYGQKFSEEKRNEYRLNDQGINTAVMQFSNPWMKYFLSIVPEKYIKKIICPVLAINGTKDIQVHADSNLEAIEKYLSNGKCRYFEIRKLEGLNHLFQKVEKGTVDEYFRTQNTISEEVLIIMKGFILNYPTD
ncbi:MAG TPA: alpha/beta fold hydrolase [Bacteroidales bacterium]|nr:alpha/beta fold hydrolase [Bacteroidales bacterium]